MLRNAKVIAVVLIILLLMLSAATFFLLQKTKEFNISLHNSIPNMEATIAQREELLKLFTERGINEGIIYKDNFQKLQRVELVITPEKQDKLSIAVKLDNDKPSEVVTGGSFAVDNGKLTYKIYVNPDLPTIIDYNLYLHKQLIDLIVLSTQYRNQTITNIETSQISQSDLNAEDIQFRYPKQFLTIKKK